MSGLRVRVDPRSDREVRDALDVLRESFANRVLRNAAGKAARRTRPSVKKQINKVSGAYGAAVAAKVARVGRKSIYVGLVGPQTKFTRRHPLFGYRTSGTRWWSGSYEEGFSVNPGDNRPTKYSHLLEGGRKPVAPKRSKVLAFVVPTLKPGKRGGEVPKGGQSQDTRKGKPGRAIRVRGGGYLVFAKRVGPAPPRRPVQSQLPVLRDNAERALVEETTHMLTTIRDRRAAAGKTIFRSG